MKKRIIPLILALIMCLMLVPGATFAAEPKKPATEDKDKKLTVEEVIAAGLTVKEGSKFTVADMLDISDKVRYVSSRTDVATISSKGVISGKNLDAPK